MKNIVAKRAISLSEQVLFWPLCFSHAIGCMTKKLVNGGQVLNEIVH